MENLVKNFEEDKFVLLMILIKFLYNRFMMGWRIL